MEVWKVHKFCEGASLSELLQRREQLSKLMVEKITTQTNASQVLEILDEYIELKSLFEKKD